MYKYFEPNIIAVFNKPIISAKLIKKSILEKVEKF